MSADPLDAPDDEVIRLSVPARNEQVQVVRAAVRAVGGRAGCSDDARSRLQAAVGAAFFEVVERAAPDANVRTEMRIEPARALVRLGADPPSAPLEERAFAGLADGHELSDHDRVVELWVRRDR